MNKLLEHFKLMQSKAAEYIEPSGRYKNRKGTAKASTGEGETLLFANDMIEMLDSPEQREAQADAEFDFVEQCMRTASDKFHGYHMPLSELKRRMSNFMQAADELDYAKKLLFYGEDKAKGRFAIPINELGKHNCYEAINKIEQYFDSREDAELFLHGVIGAATETGELVEAAYRAIFQDQPLDLVNVKEETGDQKWYLALIAKACGFMWGDDERAVINKLRKRYPDKFTSDKANNRDLETERMTFEEASELITVKPDNNA